MNELIGIDYVGSLRQILRHGPDVIMIGEIRDEKTAKLAITAALTGHLVLSTIHASNALLVIKRLINLGIDKDDLEDVLIGIVSQKMKYDLELKKALILPEMLNRKEIKDYFNRRKINYLTFRKSALYLIKEEYCSSYLFEEELHE